MTNSNDDVALRTTESRCLKKKKKWRTPKLQVCDSVPSTSNSKTYTPSDSYVNPNVS